MASKITLHNQIELPPIDDFRLQQILVKVVNAETQQLSDSILTVKNQFQADLRQELRHSLSREQRIQHKNIEVVKKADSVRKKMKSRKKRWARLSGGTAEVPNAALSFGERPEALAVELGSLRQTAGSISSGVLGLAARLSALDALSGGSGLPNRNNYPMLYQLLQPETQENVRKVPGRSSEPVEEDSSLAPADTMQESESTSPEFVPKPVAEPELAEPELGEESDEINSEIFESLIEEYNRKSRLKSERRAREMPQTGKNTERPRNPLRLLSARGSIGSLDSAVSDPVENRFFPAKSVATVGESPELSLHKKLRINALPLSNKRDQSCKCSKETPADGENAKAKGEGDAESKCTAAIPNSADSAEARCAKSSLSTFLSNYDAQFDNSAGASFDLDFDSSGIHSDSDLVSSDSSDSFMGNIGDTNEYYDSLRRVMKRNRKRQSSRSFKETSPNPKHQPSHRTLQPKQSILKLQRRKPCEQTCDSVQENTHSECQFMASPRASFVMEHSAAGEILRADQDPDNEPEPEALSRLRTLLL